MWGIITGSILGFLVMAGLIVLSYIKWGGTQNRIQKGGHKFFEGRSPEQDAQRIEEFVASNNIQDAKIIVDTYHSGSYRYTKLIWQDIFEDNQKRFMQYWAYLGSTLVGGLVAGLFTLFASIHSVGNTEVALIRNKATGSIRIQKDAGIGVYNPLEEIHRATKTQVEKQFGNEDPTKGLEGYIPFNDKAGNEFNASMNVKWEINNNDLAQSLQDLYATTGDTNVKADQIISTIRSKATNILADYVQNTNAVQIPSEKSQMSQKLEQELQQALDKFGVVITQITINDVVAPEAVLKQIEQTSIAATKTQVATQEALALKEELQVTKAQQAISMQESLNKLLENPYISAELLAEGVDITDTAAIQAALSSGTFKTDIQTMVKQDQYFSTWDGQLPKVMDTTTADKVMVTV